jgi:hypothetical protein
MDVDGIPLMNGGDQVWPRWAFEAIDSDASSPHEILGLRGVVDREIHNSPTLMVHCIPAAAEIKAPTALSLRLAERRRDVSHIRALR